MNSGLLVEKKQGDPLSSLLFNSVLQSAMEKDIKVGKEKSLGHQIERREKRLHVQPEIC